MLLAVNLQNFTVVHDYTQNKQAIIDALDHHFVAYPWQTHQGAWVAERFVTAFETLRRVSQATARRRAACSSVSLARSARPRRTTPTTRAT